MGDQESGHGKPTRQDRTGRFDPVTNHEIRTKEKSERIGGSTRNFGFGSDAALQRGKALDKAVKTNLLKGNTVARKKARLSAMVKKAK